MILLASVRGDGLSLPKIARRLLGPVSGTVTTVATLFIIIVTLAGVAKVVVIALSESSWGMFTIVVTIPAALITGLWMNKIRPGRVAEASLIGVSLVLLGVFLGKPFDDSAARTYLVFTQSQLAVILPVYAAIASILPVWVLLCPRDYLSSYMKIGVIALLAVGILIAHPVLKMPATTPFIHGGGPVVPGTVWPFVCIVIMCGALSGFHALISSGTTPKMIAKESDILPVAYGAMLLEGFVSVTALIAACALEPGDYFKINIAQDKYAAVVAEVEGALGLDMRTKEFNSLQESTGEHNLAGKTGGAVTLAVGMAKVFSALPGMGRLMGYWYHFVIMFEALFILTLLETGTRVARFIFQETVQPLLPELFARGPRSGLGAEHRAEPGRLRLVGLPALFRQHRHLVANNGHRQSIAGHDRAWPSARRTSWNVPDGAATPSAPASRWRSPWPRYSRPACRASKAGGGSLPACRPVRRRPFI